MAVGALSLLVFGDVAPNLIDSPYLLFPALIWAAVRLGPQGAVTAMGLVSAIAVWGTIRGSGPFTGQTLHESLLMLQAFMSVVAVTTLVLAAVVAERRKADAVAQEQREWLAVTLASIGDAVIVTDTQGRVTFVNPVAASVTGWPEAEALGKDITAVFQIINEHTRQVVENPIARVLREDTVVGLAPHTLLIARDGVERPIDDSSAPLRAPRGSLLGVVLVFRDITERKRAEDTRARLTAEVERRRRETEMLADLAQSLSASLDLDTVLQRVVAGAQELCASERAILMLREPNSGVLTARYAVGAPQMAYAGLRIEPGKGMGGQVLRTGASLAHGPLCHRSTLQQRVSDRGLGRGNISVLAVPILTGPRVDGVFYVSNPLVSPLHGAGSRNSSCGSPHMPPSRFRMPSSTARSRRNSCNAARPRRSSPRPCARKRSSSRKCTIG